MSSRLAGSPATFANRPEHLGPAEIRAYLLYLTNDRRLAASSVIVAVSALRFFYTVTLKRLWAVEDDIPAGKQAKKLPVVLSQEEVFVGRRGKRPLKLIVRNSASFCQRDDWFLEIPRSASVVPASGGPSVGTARKSPRSLVIAPMELPS